MAIAGRGYTNQAILVRNKLVPPAVYGGSLPVTSGLTCDLQSDTLALANGADVLNWVDSSVAGNSAIPVDANEPTYLIPAFPSGKNGVAFNGTNQVLRIRTATDIQTNLFPNNAASMFTVFIPRSFGTSGANSYDNDAVFSEAGQNFGMYLHSTTPSLKPSAWDGTDDANTHTIAANTAYVAHMRWTGSNFISSLNGGTETSIAHGNTLGVNNRDIIFGGVTTFFSDVVIGAFIAYNRILTTQEILDTNNYLLAKYLAYTPKVRVGGAWVKATSMKVRVGGAWVTPTAVKVRQSGAWVTLT